MKTTTLIGIMVLLMIGSAQANTYTHYANLWEGEYGCTEELIEDNLVTGLGRFEISEGEVDIHADRTLSDDPECTFLYLKQNGASQKNQWYKTHGSHRSYRGFQSDHFSTTAARDLQMVAMAGADIDTSYAYFDTYTHEGGAVIYARDSAISEYLASQLPWNAFIYGGYCNSWYTFDDWGIPEASMSEGKSMVVTSIAIGKTTNCSNIADLVADMGCWNFPSTGHQLDDAFRNGIWNMSIVGWQQAQWVDNYDCWLWKGKVIYAAYVDGEARVVYFDEDKYSMYYVIAEGDTLYSTPGLGSDGNDLIRCHSFPCEYQSGMVIVEVDDYGTETWSKPLRQESNEHWNYWQQFHNQSLDEYEQYTHEQKQLAEQNRVNYEPPRALEVSVQERFEEWREHVQVEEQQRYLPGIGEVVERVYNGGRSECEECADYLILADDDWWWGYAIDWGVYQVQERHPDWVVKTIQYDGNNRWAPRELLRELRDANEESNNQYGTNYPVQPTPEMMIIGSYDVLDLPEVLDTCDDCIQDSCHTMEVYTYLDNPEGPPQGPIAWVNADDEAQAISFLINGWKMNRHEDVDETGKFLGFSSDLASGGAGSAPTDSLLAIREMYSLEGQGLGPVLKESDYNWDERKNIGVYESEQGFRDLWFTGYEVASFHWTDFWPGHSDLPDLLDKDQVVNIIGSGCETAADWWEDYYNLNLMEMAWRQDKTRFAVIVGNLSAAHGEKHERFLYEFAKAYFEEPLGTSFPMLVWIARMAMWDEYPEYVGMVSCGGHVVSWRETSTGANEDVEFKVPENKLYHTLGISVSRLHLRVQETAHAELKIYDVQGRHVRTLGPKLCDELVTEFTWRQDDEHGRPVPGGMYYATAKVDYYGRSEELKTAVLALIRQ